jgi:Replication protein
VSAESNPQRSGGALAIQSPETAPEGARLDNNANKSSPRDAQDRRNDRITLRYGLNRVTTIDRVRKCGRCPRTAAGIEVRVRDGVAGFAGLVSCGSVWVCPVCSAKIAQQRAIEIGLRVSAAFESGLSALFMTNTVRHGRQDALATLLDGLGYGWGRMTSGKIYSAQRAEVGVIGYSRALEVTWGPANGWHPHYHSLWFAQRLHELDQAEDFGYSMWARFDQGVQKAGLRSTLASANDWQRVTPKDRDASSVGKYLAKVADPAGIGYELTHTQSKTARDRNSTAPHWSLLRQAVHGVTPDLWLWHEYERATKGRKQLVNSKHLDELLGVKIEDRADDDIAAEELGTEADALVVITPAGWSRLVASLRYMLGVLEVAPHGQGPLAAYLDAIEVEYDVR